MPRCEEYLETKELKINTSKSKVMVSEKNCGDVERRWKSSCAVCEKGVVSNSVQCRGCGGWVHKHCSVCKVYERAGDDGEDTGKHGIWKRCLSRQSWKVLLFVQSVQLMERMGTELVTEVVKRN